MSKAKKAARDAQNMLESRPWYDQGKDAERENLTDALVNLRHWAESRGVNFDEALEISLGHYHAEGGAGRPKDDITLDAERLDKESE